MHVQTMNLNIAPSGALNPYLRVKLNGSNQLAAAAAGDVELGTLAERVLSDDNIAAVVPSNAEGTRYMVAAAAITKGNRVFGADGGKISEDGNGNFEGIALEDASGDGSQIEVLTLNVDARRLDAANTETLSGNKTLTATDARIQSLDPDGARDITLPAEEGAAGLDFIVNNTADGAEVMTIKNDNGDTIATPGQNEAAWVFCDGASWFGIVGANN